jgi:hypothetical protein
MSIKSEDGLTHGWDRGDQAEWNNRTRLVPTWRMVWVAFAAGMILSAWASYGVVTAGV